MAITEVKVPDIGDFKDIPVIEVMVKVGDTIKAEDALISLESDKATMDVPSPAAGTVKEVKVKVGDRLSEGSLVLLLERGGAAAARLQRPLRPRSRVRSRPRLPLRMRRAASPKSAFPTSATSRTSRSSRSW